MMYPSYTITVTIEQSSKLMKWLYVQTRRLCLPSRLCLQTNTEDIKRKTLQISSRRGRLCFNDVFGFALFLNIPFARLFAYM